MTILAKAKINVAMLNCCNYIANTSLQLFINIIITYE